eukprot:4651553-Amphidinium_carterae.1
MRHGTLITLPHVTLDRSILRQGGLDTTNTAANGRSLHAWLPLPCGSTSKLARARQRRSCADAGRPDAPTLNVTRLEGGGKVL